MAVIKFQNQSDYAFLIWMSNFPESGHPLDSERFYVFAKTVARYRNKKWLDYSYFEERILKHTPKFDKEEIEKFWYKLLELVKFYKTGTVPAFGDDGLNRYGLYQRGVKNGKMYEVKISKEEYYGGGASKETMKNADYF